MRREQALEDRQRRGRVVVAVHDVDELHVRVLLELGLHVLDPGVLVRRRGGGRQDRHLPGAAEQFGHVVDLGRADLCGVGLVDEQVGAAIDVGVERHDDDARVSGLLDRRTQGVGIVAGDHDGVGLVGDGRLDRRDLCFSRGHGARADDLGAAELLERRGAAPSAITS